MEANAKIGGGGGCKLCTGACEEAPFLFLSREAEKLGALTDTFVLVRNALLKEIAYCDHGRGKNHVPHL